MSQLRVERARSHGDLRWNGTEWRRWDGRRWGRAVAAVLPSRLKSPALFADDDAVGDDWQTRALALAVEDEVTEHRAHVIYEGPRGTVIAYPRRVSHFMHAVLTVLTGGLWAIVWLAAATGRREDRVRLEVDRYGNVWATPVRGA